MSRPPLHASKKGNAPWVCHRLLIDLWIKVFATSLASHPPLVGHFHHSGVTRAGSDYWRPCTASECSMLYNYNLTFVVSDKYVFHNGLLWYFLSQLLLLMFQNPALSLWKIRVLGQFQREFHEEFHDIKYHQFCWRGKERERWSFMECEESFITMKLIWHSYLVLSLGIYVHETPTETGLTLFGLCLSIPSEWNDFFYQSNLIMAFLEKYTGKRKKEIQSQ